MEVSYQRQTRLPLNTAVPPSGSGDPTVYCGRSDNLPRGGVDFKLPTQRTTALAGLLPAGRCIAQGISSIASEISRVQPSEELCHRAVERDSDPDDLAGAGISLPTLDPTNVVSVGLASAGERLLR